MGLITKEVLISWHHANKKYYEEKGYPFTKYGDEFLVKVEVLPNSSHYVVNIKCDGCKNELKPIEWKVYKNYVHEDGNYYCNKCAIKIRDENNKTKSTMIENSKSFETWCIDNNRQDVLDRWDYELNYLNPYDVPSKSSKKYWFKCNINIHNSELNGIADLTSGKQININCKQCNSFAQWGIDNIGEDFLEKYWDYDKNININPWGINYGNNTKNKRVWIKCQEKDYHGSYKTSCNEFTSNGRCPLCTNQHGKVHPLDSLGTLYPKVLELWSDKNDKSPYEYAPQSSQQVYWKCKDAKHDDYLREIRNSQSCEFDCPYCVAENNYSKLQSKTVTYLEELNYKILHENNCTISPKNMLKVKKIKSSSKLRYDNEIIFPNDKHLIIEVHGCQHYIINSWHIQSAIKNNTSPEEELQYQIDKDKYKEDYAIKMGYEYLIIPYWTEKDESYKSLIDKKIENILN